MTTRFTGLYPATLTPFNKDGSINLEGIDKYAKHFIDGGMDGVFVNGTSGESMSLSINERKKVIEEWVAANKKHNGKLQIIAHIGAQSVEDSKELAKHAESVGAAGISAMAPAFFKPKSLEQLIEYLNEIAKAASNTPFFYYHFPGITGVDFPVHKVLSEGAKKFSTMRGAKFTGYDMRDLNKSISLEGGRFDLLNGFEFLWLPAVSIGGVGAVGLSANLCPELFRDIEKYGQDKDAKGLAKAQEAQRKIIQLFDIIEKQENYMSPFKHIMKWLIGIDFGPVRTPLKNMTDSEAEEMIKQLEALGFKTNQ
ncbi:N-acetylneuraminate lyase [Acrasis kona]|uniref:N-acetylneuraminate lyase n=1 Tax=Acrasis kona TaxID=1008807 RepID=A0AAW2ZQB5_9EUKA